MESINKTISDAKDAVKELIKKAHEKQLEAEPGRTMMESFENRVNQVLIASALLSYYIYGLCLCHSEEYSVFRLSCFNRNTIPFCSGS
jgi:hypothetical protein